MQQQPLDVTQPIDAVYEHGTFRVLDTGTVNIPEGQRVRLIAEPVDKPESVLDLLGQVYDGLSEEEIEDIEEIILDRSNFFGDREQP